MDDSSEDEPDLLDDLDVSDAEDYDDEEDVSPDEEDVEEEDMVDDTILEEEYASPPPPKLNKPKTTTLLSHNSTQDLFSQYLEVLRAPPFTSLQLKDRMKLCTSQTDSQKTCVMKTIGELMQTRGFKIDTSMLLPKFKTADCIFATNTKEHILMILYANVKVSIQLSREIDQCITNNTKIRQLVIVTSEGITPIAKKLLMITKSCNVQFFHFMELIVNYTKHKLVPFHKKLEDKEIQEKFKKYNLTKQQLATMDRTDPIVKFYGWKAGSIIQCIKKLGLSMESYESLRLVK
jgi:DNA-directed RNA polymerase subunit H (RpoH/RPB5)